MKFRSIIGPLCLSLPMMASAQTPPPYTHNPEPLKYVTCPLHGSLQYNSYSFEGAFPEVDPSTPSEYVFKINVDSRIDPFWQVSDWNYQVLVRVYPSGVDRIQKFSSIQNTASGTLSIPVSGLPLTGELARVRVWYREIFGVSGSYTVGSWTRLADSILKLGCQ